MDVRDGLIQNSMRERDIPYTAVIIPSGIFWEWIVLPQGLNSASETFNKCVKNLIITVRDFGPGLFRRYIRPYPGYGWEDGRGG